MSTPTETAPGKKLRRRYRIGGPRKAETITFKIAESDLRDLRREWNETAGVSWAEFLRRRVKAKNGEVEAAK
jgi:hypothetical protein